MFSRAYGVCIKMRLLIFNCLFVVFHFSLSLDVTYAALVANLDGTTVTEEDLADMFAMQVIGLYLIF